jgi:hypothetical protein
LIDRRGIGDGVDERRQRGDAGHAVGDRVVEPHEQADSSIGQAGQEPHLPQGPRPVQPPLPQLCTGRQQLRLVGWSSQREHAHMLSQVDRRRVDPQRPPQPEPGLVQQLPEPGNKLEPGLDMLLHPLNLEASLGIQQPPAIQDDQRTDVLGPPKLLGPQHHQILGA